MKLILCALQKVYIVLSRPNGLMAYVMRTALSSGDSDLFINASAVGEERVVTLTCSLMPVTSLKNVFDKECFSDCVTVGRPTVVVLNVSLDQH